MVMQLLWQSLSVMHNTRKTFGKIEGDQSPKTLEQQNVPSISPLITGQLVNTYNKLESVEAKREFESVSMGR